MGKQKDVKELIRWAERRGWQATRSGKGHLKFTRPGRPPVITAWTPSDHRTIKNATARIRRLE